MATEVICRVVPGGLMAVNQAEATKLEELVGKEVRATITRPRNLEFHKKWWAFLRTTFDMVDLDLQNVEQWRFLVLIGIGHCTFFQTPDGMQAIPKSVSFAAVDDTEFERIYSDSIAHVCEKYLDDDPAHLRQVLEFIS